MCMYSVAAEDGCPTEWHKVHLGSRAVGGAGLIITEATAVEARGRISTRDLGLWNDAQAEAFAPITRFMADNGAAPAIQLAHAGRKADAPGSIGPSPLAFSADYATPREMNLTDIETVVDAFRAATLRALNAGFQVVEIHAAHGYLLHEFLSPLSNLRTDKYGGSFENRIRFTMDVTRAVREVWPDELPLFVRISATDWAVGGWDVEQSVALSRRLKAVGVNLIDVSSGGLTPDQKIVIGPGYQVPFAVEIRKEAEIMTGAVGLITEAVQANAIITSGQADAVLIGRQSLRDPYFPLRAALELGAESIIPTPYARGW